MARFHVPSLIVLVLWYIERIAGLPFDATSLNVLNYEDLINATRTGITTGDIHTGPWTFIRDGNRVVLSQYRAPYRSKQDLYVAIDYLSQYYSGIAGLLDDTGSYPGYTNDKFGDGSLDYLHEGFHFRVNADSRGRRPLTKKEAADIVATLHQWAHHWMLSSDVPSAKIEVVTDGDKDASHDGELICGPKRNDIRRRSAIASTSSTDSIEPSDPWTNSDATDGLVIIRDYAPPYIARSILVEFATGLIRDILQMALDAGGDLSREVPGRRLFFQTDTMDIDITEIHGLVETRPFWIIDALQVARALSSWAQEWPERGPAPSAKVIFFKRGPPASYLQGEINCGISKANAARRSPSPTAIEARSPQGDPAPNELGVPPDPAGYAMNGYVVRIDDYSAPYVDVVDFSHFLTLLREQIATWQRQQGGNPNTRVPSGKITYQIGHMELMFSETDLEPLTYDGLYTLVTVLSQWCIPYQGHWFVPSAMIRMAMRDDPEEFVFEGTIEYGISPAVNKTMY